MLGYLLAFLGGGVVIGLILYVAVAVSFARNWRW